MKRYRFVWHMLTVLTVATLTLSGVSKAQEGTGTVRQPLVGGSVVDASQQEDFGLLGYSDNAGVCSASLLRNNWAITAAHCVEARNASGNPIPDLTRPGQNVLNPLATMTLTAAWRLPQSQGVVRVETFRPYDVALIQLTNPFIVRGLTNNFSRLLFDDGQFPYGGWPVYANLLVFGQGINAFASGEGNAAVPSQADGQYRMSYGRPESYDYGELYWYPSLNGQMIAGGDSGGPSFTWGLSGYSLVGVHSAVHVTYVPGKPKIWMWATSTPEAADAFIKPLIPQINAIMGPMPPLPPEPALEPPPPGFIGKFGTTPPNFQPLVIYGIRPNGEMLWYRKDTNASAWQGPSTVGTGWNNFKDVIAAGGNTFYALTQDSKLLWYQHDGFNDGSFAWSGPVEVGRDWTFSRIFSGGNGIVYAITSDGTLLWYKNNGARHGMRSWEGPKVVGSGWGQLKDVFSTGKGSIYVVRDDGRLSFYQHLGYPTGVPIWLPERIVGTQWNQFQQIIPSGDGVILAIRPNGELLLFKHLGPIRPAGGFGFRWKEGWDVPGIIGTRWQDFGKVIALIPDPFPPIH